MDNPYKQALETEMKSIDKDNPFVKENDEKEEDNPSKVKIINSNNKGDINKTLHYEERPRTNSYFNLILDSDFRTIELETRGLRYVTFKDPTTGKKVIQLERKEGHYLSQEGGEYILNFLQMNTSTDLKLGHLTEKEFKQTMEILTKSFISFIRQNLQKLGADTYEKQDKVVQLTIATLNRIRSVYSRSIEGKENKRSHGDITLTGALDMERENKFNLEDIRN